MSCFSGRLITMRGEKSQFTLKKNLCLILTTLAESKLNFLSYDDTYVYNKIQLHHILKTMAYTMLTSD